MDRLRIDLRFARRLLVNSPFWSATAIVSLALAIGANAAVFSLVDAILLNPFPYKDPDGLVLLWGSKREDVKRGLSGADLEDWRQQSGTLEDLDAFLGNLTFSLGPTELDRVKAACIGHRVLPMLGVQPRLGRNFTAAEARYGAAPVAIISDDLWRTRFASDAAIVGGAIRLNDTPYEIVGVMPPRFFFPDTDARLWVPSPCGFPDFERREAMLLNAIARLRSGSTAALAQTELDTITARLAREHQPANARKTVGVFPLRHIVIGRYERALWTLATAMAVLLLIACANVMHLLLARGVDRETELAVRAAAGASRRRLFRQLLTEVCLLTIIALFGGLAVAWLGVRSIHALALTDIPRVQDARVDVAVLGYTLVLSAIAALASGLWPAWKASGARVSDTLKLGTTSTTDASRSHLRDLLAITEIGAAATLLVAAGLVGRSFVELSRADWGFTPEKLLLIDLKNPQNRGRNDSFFIELSEAVLKRLRALPGVEHVAASRNAPIRWSSWAPRPVSLDGIVVPNLTAAVWTVGRGHFSAAGIALHEGREFSDADDESAPRRIVVSRALAKRLWPNQTALGKTLEILEYRTLGEKLHPDIEARMRRRDPTLRTDTSVFEPVEGIRWDVIGVVNDVRAFGLDIQPDPAMYIELRQEPRIYRRLGAPSMKILIRTTGDPGAIAEPAKAQILAASPDVTFNEVVPLADLVAQSIGGRGSNRLLLVVATIFGTLALTFATIGIYSVVTHNVTQRLREIGIRIALGAASRDVVRMVLGYGFRLLLSGLALGVTVAWALTRGMEPLLFSTATTDPMTYSIVVVTLTIAAGVACVIPLRRALRLDPLTLFRA